MAKLLYVMPVDTSAERVGRVHSFLKSLAVSDTEVDIISLPGGPPHLEYYEQDHEAITMMIERIPATVNEREIDAVVIACFYDPGVRELREMLDIPVIGIGEASMHLASLLGHRFSVLVGRKKWIPKMSDNALLYGFDRRITSWHSIECTVLGMQADPEAAFEAMVREGRSAVNDYRAEVLVLGCAAMENAAPRLSALLGVPVVNPVVAGFKMAEVLGDLRCRTGLTISKAYDYERANTER